MGITKENDLYYMKIAHIHLDGPGQPGLSHLTLFRIVNNCFKSISNNYTAVLLRNHDPGIHDHPEHPNLVSGHMLGLANIIKLCKGSRCSMITGLRSSLVKFVAPGSISEPSRRPSGLSLVYAGDSQSINGHGLSVCIHLQR